MPKQYTCSGNTYLEGRIQALTSGFCRLSKERQRDIVAGILNDDREVSDVYVDELMKTCIAHGGEFVGEVIQKELRDEIERFAKQHSMILASPRVRNIDAFLLKVSRRIRQRRKK